MSSSIIPDETLVTRLPLPLAQLYRRAHNAKSPLERHLTAFYLWEASIKLLGAVCVVEYADLGQPNVELADCLQHLARPSLGHWWEFIRRLLPVLAEHGPAAFVVLRDGLLGKRRDDLPRTAGLDAALRNVLDGKSGARATVYPAELLERLVRYRNKEIGHGAAGHRPADFYEHLAASLLLAAQELLARFDVLAGRSLLFLPDIRQVQGQWLIERFELSGETARRLESWTLPREAATALPDAGQVHLARSTETSVSSLVRLHPLVAYDAEADECAFLNARRGKSGTEYLCYTTGQTSVRADLGNEQRKLLARALGMADVCEAQTQQWAAQCTAEVEPVPEIVVGPRRLGEYELFSELGRGGMGIVYRAWQPSLGRQVALKCLTQSGDAKAEARFRREIRALGRVEHAHVVKVFASGSDGEQWFYVMELVEGVPLSAVCDKLATSVTGVTEVDVPTWHKALQSACAEARRQEKPLSDRNPAADVLTMVQVAEPTPKPRGRREYVARIVALMRQTAEAAHALHERGILHRDIKPGNIMVSPDGVQATLMDLGLAQLADDVEGRLTRTRQFVGTLRYASPQQVLAVAHLDRRSDVYSLGATLWELLALQPLFGATEQTPTPELMEKIQREEPARLRRLHPALSRNLEAVVHKCLEKSPERRYATARDLAEDLRRAQEGEPVNARPVGRLDRTLKWTRRHPAQTTALALLVTTVSALAGGIALIARANGRLQEANGRLADETTRTAHANAGLTAANVELAAERNRTQQANTDLKAANRQLTVAKARTRKALDRMTSEVMDDLLARQKVLTDQQKKFLTEALAQYEDLARETGANEQTRAGIAFAYLRVGYIRDRLGLTDGAAQAYRQSQQQYTRLAADFPALPEYRSHLADSHNYLGDLLTHTGYATEAAEEYKAALAIRKQLAADFPAVPEYRSDLADSHNSLGKLLAHAGHASEAGEEYKAALAIYEQLAADFPAVPEYREVLLAIHLNLGGTLKDAGRNDAAEHEAKAALAILKQRAADFPNLSPPYRDDLANSHNSLGNLLLDTGQASEAAEEYKAALAIYKQLTADFPTVPEYRIDLASSQNNLANVLGHYMGHNAEAQQESKAALAIRKQLAADYPTVPEYRRDLGNSHYNLGILLLDAGHASEAAGEYKAALAVQKQLAVDYPTVPEYRRDLGNSHYNLAILLSDAGHATEAAEESKAALAIRKQLAADYPTVPEYRSDLAWNHQNLGWLLVKTGKPQDAETEYRAALAIFERLAAEFATVPEYRRGQGQCHHNLGLLLSHLGDPREAEKECRCALAIRTQLVADFPTLPGNRSDLAWSHNNLGWLLVSTGKPREADGECRAALAIFERLAADFPTVPEYREGEGYCHNNLGAVSGHTGRSQEAEREHRSAVAIRKRLAADVPSNMDYQSALARSHNDLGSLLAHRGKLQAAEQEIEAALAIRRQLVASLPAAAEHQQDIAETLGDLARLCRARKDLATARRLLEQAIPHDLAALHVYPRDHTYRFTFRENATALGQTLVGLGRHAEAAADADRLIALAVTPPDDDYNASCILALCVPLAQKDAKLPVVQRQKLAQSYADRAMAALQKAVAAGFRDVKKMQRDQDLDSVRDRADFKKLMASLKPSSPKAEPMPTRANERGSTAPLHPPKF